VIQNLTPFLGGRAAWREVTVFRTGPSMIRPKAGRAYLLYSPSPTQSLKRTSGIVDVIESRRRYLLHLQGHA
jgi:hypothetical protein